LSAERSLVAYKHLVQPRASTGPRSVERGEKTRLPQHSPRLRRLQRGRARLSAESSGTRHSVKPANEASTGPRSVERGEPRTGNRSCQRALLQRGRARLSAERPFGVGVSNTCQTLQRGRARLSAESRTRRTGQPSAFCFNGAALG